METVLEGGVGEEVKKEKDGMGLDGDALQLDAPH